MIKHFVLLVPFSMVLFAYGKNTGDVATKAIPETILEAAVDWSKLQDRNGDTYIPNTESPYSGWAKKSYGDGQIQILAKFTNGSVTHLKQWYENGIPHIDMGFVENNLFLFDLPLARIDDIDNSGWHNQVTEWYPNGQKSFDYPMVKGLPQDGSFVQWHENGQKELEGTYNKSGNRIGTWISWYSNGLKNSTVHWKDDKIEGQIVKWNTAGQLEENATFRHGVRLSSVRFEYHLNGQKKSIINFKNDQIEGLVTRWRPDGQIEENATYMNGRLISGVKYEWYESGQKQNEINYKNGKIDGLWTRWNRVGEIVFSINYSAEFDSNETYEPRLDQSQRLYVPQKETSFGKSSEKNWFSYTAGKNGFLNQICFYGRPNILTSEHYGQSMSGYFKEDSIDNIEKLGQWEISRDEVVRQIALQGKDDQGWISIKVHGVVPQKTGKKYFMVCDHITENKDWFGALCFSEKNPYQNGRFWLNPDHDLVFATYSSKAPLWNYGYEHIFPQFDPNQQKDEVSPIEVEGTKQEVYRPPATNSKSLYQRFFKEE